MLHQPWGGVAGQATDVEIHAREIMEWRERLNRIIVDNTSQKLETVEQVTERNYFLSPDEAVEFGLIDGIFENSYELQSDAAG